MFMIGDQQSATLGLQVAPEDVKITYGTGCFIMQNTGNNILFREGLLSTVTLQLGPEEPAFYGLEGAVESGAAILNFFQKDLRIFEDFASQDKKLLERVKNKDDFFFQNKHLKNKEDLDPNHLSSEIYANETMLIPSLNSTLFSPFWKSNVKGQLLNLTFSSDQTQIYAVSLESFCFRVKQCLDVMDLGKTQKIQIDGGVSKNIYLAHFQANLLDRDLTRIRNVDGTMRGVFLGCLAFLDRKRFAKVLGSPLSGRVVKSTNNKEIQKALLQKYRLFDETIKSLIFK